MRFTDQNQKGEKNHRAVLTEENVRMIRKDPRNNTVLADFLGVCDSTISDIRTRKTWSHVK